MKQLFTLFVLIVLFVLVTAAFVPANETIGYAEHRVEVPCASPKYEINREQGIMAPQLGFRRAYACDPKPYTVQSDEPMQFCPPGSVPLFDTPTTITENMVLSNGAVVMNVKGNWIVSEHEGTLLASGGRSLTIVFPDDTFVHGLIVFDNDPKPSQQAWSIDNQPIPTTGKASYGPMFLLGTSEKQLDFHNGDDSPHFNVCL